MQILAAFARHGAPSARVRDWTGRWWTQWAAFDLVPMGRRVLVAAPGWLNPVMDATEIEVSARDEGRIALAGGFANHGESVRRKRRGGAVTEVWLGGGCLLPEDRIVRELKSRYGKKAGGRKSKPRRSPKPH